MSPELEGFKAFTDEWFKRANESTLLNIGLFPKLFERLISIEDKLDQLLARKK